MTHPTDLQRNAKRPFGTHTDDDRPSVRLCHGAWETIIEVHPESFASLTFSDEINAAGALDMELTLDGWASDDILDALTEDRDRTLLVVVEYEHIDYRWHGVVVSATRSRSRDGGGSLVVSAVHSWQHLEGLPARPEPQNGIWHQKMNTVYTGPVRSILSQMIALNAAAASGTFPIRYESLGYTARTWNEIKSTGSGYPIAVKPLPQTHANDQSYKVEIRPEMRTVGEVIRSLAEAPDGGVIVAVNLWLPGDPQPWSGAGFTRAQLWVDVQDRSVLSAQPAVNVRFDTNYENNAPGYISALLLNRRFWTEGLRALGEGSIPARHVSDAEVAKIPIYPAVGSEGSGVLNHTVRYDQRKGGRYVYGGEMEFWFARFIEVETERFERDLEQQTQLLRGANQNSLSDSIIETYTEGRRRAHSAKVAEWTDNYNMWREWLDPGDDVAENPFALRHGVITGVPPGSFRALVEVARTAAENSSRETHEIEVLNRAPWVVFGDFGLGDLVGIRDGQKVAIQRLTSVSFSLSRGEAGTFSLVLGDPASGAGPVDKMLHQMEKFRDKPVAHQ